MTVFLFPTISPADQARGKRLFREKYCILCHDENQSGTVIKPICPGLKHIHTRHSREWLGRWLADPKGVWQTNDADVQDINRRYFQYRGSKPKPRESFMATVIGKTVKLLPDEIEDLIDYLLTL